jgi:MFS family permease
MKNINLFRGMRSFLILLSGQSLSRLGSAMTSFALVLWVYERQGSAMSVALLTCFTYLPSVLLAFVAGVFADRWDKKMTMLASDCIAALGTVCVFLLHCTNTLQIWHLYLINFVMSLMNIFQAPASYVATSLLVPKEQYSRASGLQSFSRSGIDLLTPVLAAMLFAFGGLDVVLIVDLATFAAAFCSLLFLVRLPSVPQEKATAKESFLRSGASGLKFLRERKPLLKLILYMAFINFISYITGYGILPAMILSRSGGDTAAYGFVSSAMGVGMLAGSVFVTLMESAKRKTRVVFLAITVSFCFGDILWGFGRTMAVWMLAGFGSSALLPFMSASLFTIMRSHVPETLQGRVFAARDTLQYFTIPIGLFLGGFLADYVFEPFMRNASPVAEFLARLVGTGVGSGMAVMFLITGAMGVMGSFLSLRDPIYKELDL